MARVFVSHAGDGSDPAREVHRWLVEAGHAVFLDRDRRDGIAVGDQWRQRLHERLRWADAVVCVLTAAYPASRWCAAEVEIARSRGSRLLPLRAEPGVVDPALESVQHIDMARDPAAAQAELVAVLRQVDAAGGLGWPDDRSPFPGLHPFDVDQHQVFFGRDEERKELAELLRAPAVRAGGTALLVVGPSGCGKSSLVRAGLLPVMAGEPGWWTLAPIVPGADPVTALVRELAAAARRIGLGWTVAQVRQQLDDGGLVGLVDELLLAAPGGPQRRLLVVADQFEELLTQTAPPDRARFVELLRPALVGSVQLVATLRSEFLDQLLTDPTLGGIATHTYTLRPLGREGLRAAIESPARLAGIEVDAALVDRLVEDTDTGDALPLLAFTLAQLAEGVCRGGQLSTTRYDQLGGVRGALTRQADAALAAAVTAGGRSRHEVIVGLLGLVTVDEQGRPTRWWARRDELPGPVVIELDAFVERRLLTTDDANGSGVIGVAHEAFLSAWPPLHEAIMENASALRARRAINHAATGWHDHDRPPARLWGGGQLAAAVADTGAHIGTGPPSPNAGSPHTQGPARWLPRRHRVLVTDRVDLSPTARDFLHASIRRDRHRRRRAVTVLSALLVLALVGAGIAVIQERAAQVQQRIATARQLIAQADDVRDSDPRTALQLGIAAQRIHSGDESQSSLFNTLTNTRYAGTLTGHTGSVSSVAFAPDESTLATAGEDGSVILWDLTDRTQPRQLGPSLNVPNRHVGSPVFAPDGRTLAATAEGSVILWDLTNRHRPRRLGQPLTGHVGLVGSVAVAFAPDGSTLATAGADGTVILWDLTDRARPEWLGSSHFEHTDSLDSSVVFAPDGRTLAASVGGSVILWDLTDRTQPRQLGPPLNVPNRYVGSLVFAPDGRTLAIGGEHGSVALWDLTEQTRPRQLGQLAGRPGSLYLVYSVAFAPDGRTLATTDSDYTVILWDLTDRTQPRQLGQPFSHPDLLYSAAFTPDGRTLATGGDDGTVALWDLTDRNRPRQLGAPLNVATRYVRTAALAPDGRTLATAGDEGTVVLWDLTDPTQPRQLGQPPINNPDSPYFVNSVAFAPDGRTLAAADNDSTVILWDLTDRNRPRRLGQPLTGHGGPVGSVAVAFAPDGRTLATADSDSTVILWDLTDRNRLRRLGQPLTGHGGPVGSVAVAFAPDGRTLAAVGSEGSVILWDFADRNRPRRLGQPLTGDAIGVGSTVSAAFAPDGRTLATAGIDSRVILWDLTDRNRPRRLGQPLTGHVGMVSSVAFAPDGRTLTTGGDDGSVILWDLSDRNQPRRLGQPLTGHVDAVSSVAFASDVPTLATADGDGTVILWDLSGLDDLRDHAVKRACSITGRGLDHDEWARYISGLPYQQTCSG